MRIFDKILSLEEFTEQPPILVDIGASGEINSKWKKISRHSICIAFDADQREMGYVEKENDFYKKLYVYNCVAFDRQENDLDFYLTKQPFCSSALNPNLKELDNFLLRPLFEVVKVEKVHSNELINVLKELNITYVDWFKSDAQGVDLRLFKNLGNSIIDSVLIAEFEPGIMDAYEGEDKLYSVMSYLESHKFWMANINVKGSVRANINKIGKYVNSFEQKYFPDLHKISPGWAEVTYLRKPTFVDRRSLLLAWIFSIIEGQYGFALELACLGKEVTSDEIFDELIQETQLAFRSSYLKTFPLFLYQKIKSKFNSVLNHA